MYVCVRGGGGGWWKSCSHEKQGITLPRFVQQRSLLPVKSIASQELVKIQVLGLTDPGRKRSRGLQNPCRGGGGGLKTFPHFIYQGEYFENLYS